MGEVLLEKISEDKYAITLQKVSYNSPSFPILVYTSREDIEGHFLIWRRDKEEPYLCPIGIAHSKEELPQKVHKHARNLAEKFARNFGFKLTERADVSRKEESLENIAITYPLGQGSC